MTGPTLQPPLFDAHASLATVLTWEGLPHVLRRALTRAISLDTLERVTFADSLGSLDPRFREWHVGLLALDIGVDLHDGQRDNLIGIFSQSALGAAPMTRFCIHGVGLRHGFGASFRAPTPTDPATLCAAAYVCSTDTGLVDSEFVFIAGPSKASATQVELALLHGTQLDDSDLEQALGPVAKQLAEVGNIDHATAVIKEALLECRQTLVPREREQQW